MDAILSSPSQGSPMDSPNSSSSSIGSPGLPDFSSPFTAANLLQQQNNKQTPTRINTASPLAVATPAWLTEDLEEEWIDNSNASAETMEEVSYEEEITEEYEGPETPRQQTIYFSPQSAMPSIARSRSTTTPDVTGSPTIMAPNSNRFSKRHDCLSEEDGDELEDEEEAVIGTFVIRDSPVGSMVIQDDRIGGGDQLKAAIRALKGASSGLGGDDNAQDTEDDATPLKKNIGGLMNLFQPPPSAPTTASKVVVPTAVFFEFTPPAMDRTVHLPSPLSPLLDVSTPLQSTTHVTRLEAMAPKHRERYIRSDIAAAPRLAASSSSTIVSIPSPALSSPHPDELRFEPASPFPLTPALKAPASTFFATPQLPQSATLPELRLFESQYDTFTRDHLAALVDEIDGLGTNRANTGSKSCVDDVLGRRGEKSQEEQDEAWETSFVEIISSGPIEANGVELEDDEDDLRGLAGRSSKRIRLSPPTSTSHITPLSSSRRMRAKKHTGSSGLAERSYRSNGMARSRRSPVTTPIVNRSAVSPVKQASAKTRDRLSTANALLDRIRARSNEKEMRARDLESLPAVAFTAASPNQSSSAVEDLTIRVESPENKWIAHLVVAASASIRTALGSPSTHFGSSLGSTLIISAPSSPSRLNFTRAPMAASSTSTSTLISSTSINRNPAHRVPVPTSPHSITSREPSMENIARSSTTAGSLTLSQRHPNLTTIGPSDITASALLTNAAGTPSRMTFDQVAGRWIKSSRTNILTRGAETSMETVRPGAEEEAGNDTTEDDPFRDFGSENSKSVVIIAEGLSGLGITASGGGLTPLLVISTPDVSISTPSLDVVEEQIMPETQEEEVTDTEPESETDEGETTEAYRFDREESPYDLYNAATGNEPDDIQNAGEEEEGPAEGYGGSLLPIDIGSPLILSVAPPAFDAATSPTSVQPLVMSLSPTSSVPLSNSVLVTPRPASRVTSSVVRPRSALKPTTRSQSDSVLVCTPDRRGLDLKAPRSVTFSDGKRHGPIRTSSSVESSADEDEGLVRGSQLKFELSNESLSDGDEGFVPMSRGSEEDLELEAEFAAIELASTSVRFSPKISEDLADLTFGSVAASTPRSIVNQSQSRTFRRTTAADATFLTECSFGVSHDRILKLITDVEPFEPDWEGLRSIDLSSSGVDSLVRLKEFLPNLDEINLNKNDISYLTGLPSLLRTLLIPNNSLTSLVSFSHLLNLERIDISNNRIDSVASLACLRHLRELKADDNRITDLGGLAQIDGLIRLSLKGNRIESLDFSVTKWNRLEMLNLSRNRIYVIVQLDHLTSLTTLNLEHNNLSELEVMETPMPKLRVLRISQNPLERLDLSFAPKLRTLFADSARLGLITGTEQLCKLENLSVRDQDGKGDALTIRMDDVRDVKRLYLSGNPVPASFPSEKFFNLVYLELAMCQLTSLPQNLSELVPNVRVLNLNFNFISDLRPLTGLTRLKKLSVLGARLSNCRAIVNVITTMPELESLDFRMNPCTLAFYPPLMLQAIPCIPPPHSDYQILHPEDDTASSRSQQWTAIDRKFKKSLPDLWRHKRGIYRSVILQMSPVLEVLDGIECGVERESLRRKVEQRNLV